MDDNNDNGGNLWLIDLIFDVFERKRIKKYNQQSRGIEEYPTITAELLLPVSSFRENIIISGDDMRCRMRLTEQIIRNSFIQKYPMIILHISNKDIENIIINNKFGIVANQQHKCFDAFTSFELQEICQVVIETCKSRYDIKPSGGYILQIVFELLASKGSRPYFSNYATCPYFRLSDQINSKFSSGLITQADVNELNKLLMMGQSECSKIDSFFFDMKAQINHIATSNANNTGGESILSAIKKGEILCVDVQSSSNIMLIELIVNSLTIAMNRGYEFSLFIDDMSIGNNDILKNALSQKSNHNSIICTKDLYGTLNGKEDIFTALTAEAKKIILSAHGSNVSAEKWSKYIGEYDKIDVSHNRNYGWSQRGKLGYNSNLGKTMSNKREYKVKPEQINNLTPGELFIYDNKTNSLIQSHLS